MSSVGAVAQGEEILRVEGLVKYFPIRAGDRLKFVSINSDEFQAREGDSL